MSISIDRDIDLKDKLKHYFGYNQFRGNQEKIIKNLLAGHDTFVIMPTGAGKSMCYQLPAIITEGLAVVISPLIALMKNQVDQMNAFGINARFLNSTLTKGEMNKVKKMAIEGELKLLYVAPESLTKEDNISFLMQAKISFVAIDEAHCISEWGHDFRPEYRKIKSIIERLGNFPTIALTATATPKVQNDIRRNLGMEEATLFKSSFNRENLYYEVRPKVNGRKQLVQFVKANTGKSGIIYCLSRKKVEEIAEFLKVNDIKALPYHAGLEPSVRMKNQDGFLNEEVDVIVATIAFGMGIDKPDVRFVIHYDAPKSLEGYYQETGRAGRDGLEGKCVMFYKFKDIQKLEKFSKDKTVTERENAHHLLEEVVAYSESASCRRRYLLHYFGEQYDNSQCGITMWCDNCKHPKPRYDATEELKLVLEAVKETNERFDIRHLAKVLSGETDEYVKSYKHDKLPIFGKGSAKNKEAWGKIIRQVLVLGFLYKHIDNYNVVRLSDQGKAYLEAPYKVELATDYDYSTLPPDKEEELHPKGKSFDRALFDGLKVLRKKVAAEKGVPPYVVFQDPSLEEMAITYPTTSEDLVHIHGVGQGKVRKFGKPFLAYIKKYVDENNIQTEHDFFVKTQVNKSKLKISIIQGIDNKVDLEEMAESLGKDYEDILNEIEHICESGTKLNIDYYIESLLDEDRQEEIYDYFMEAESDSVEDALEEFEEEYSEEEIRLMRVKFLSEMAN